MNIGEALQAASRGSLIAREQWRRWHLRFYDPFPPEVAAENGYAGTNHLRECSGWPIPTIYRDVSLTQEDVLADDWRVILGSDAISPTETCVIGWDYGREGAQP